MYKNKKILGVITARGGSKGIPKKNIHPILGKPLIAYTISAALGSHLLSDFLVSTDSEEIMAVARTFGADVPFIRPAALAHDDSKSVSVVQHALYWVQQNKGKKYDYVMILQPTSPLRISEDIDNCIKKIVDKDADSVMSMVELIDFSPAKIKKVNNDIIYPLFEDEDKESTPRQFEERAYRRNCAIYLTKVDYILRNDLFGKVSRPYIMPYERSVDINTPADIEIAEFYLTRLKST